ncbi:MAG TPA: HAMP domain-containing protein [Candidatus Ozemobacteraceae bacterium]|nr:HAMP domain-containing protein [Candidatus Ozemobacteraceae bacterium]
MTGRGRLRWRLAFAFLTVGLAPILILGWISLRVAEGYLRQTTLTRDQTLLNAVTHGLELFVRGRYDQLAHLAQQPTVQSLDAKRAAPLLRDSSSRLPFFDGLFLLDATGTVVARAGGFARTLQQHSDLEQRFLDPYRDASRWSRDREPIVRHPDAEWRARLLILRAPVSDFLRPEQQNGLLVGVMALEGFEWQEILEAFQPNDREYVCILSESGEILTRTGNGLAESATRFALGSLAAAASERRQAKTVEYLHQGRRDLLTISFSPLIGGWLLCGRPADEAFRLLYQLRETWGVALLFTLVLSLAAVLLLSQMLAQPILSLTLGLQELREGRYGYRVTTESDDELGTAARALNDLAAFLQRRYLIGSIWERFRGHRDTPSSPIVSETTPARSEPGSRVDP